MRKNGAHWRNLVPRLDFCHLLLRQPYSVFSHSDLQPDSFIGLIHDDFAFTRDLGACRVGIGKERRKGCDNIFTRAKFNNNSLEKSEVNLLGFEENYLSLQLV